MRNRLLSRQNGFTITEVVVSGVLVGVLCLIVASAFGFISKQSNAYSLNATRNALMMNLRKSVSDLNSLRASLHQPENTSLLNCVCGSPAGCTTGQSNPVSIYPPGALPPQASINYYNMNGSPCQPTDPNCLIQTQITFTAQCLPHLPSANPMPPPSCTAPAEVIGFAFTVQTNPAIANPGTLKILKSTTYMQVASIAPPGSGVCP
jgi:type II secretory pathway pseudopilin PulG